MLSAVPLFLALTGPGQAACLDNARVAELVAGYPPSPAFLLTSASRMPTARRPSTWRGSARRWVPVGYKVGFTGQALQERFAIDRPATGVLFEPMFVEDGGTVPLDFGRGPLIAPDRGGAAARPCRRATAWASARRASCSRSRRAARRIVMA
jgi:2-keto-4-pentenoate hydratase